MSSKFLLRLLFVSVLFSNHVLANSEQLTKELVFIDIWSEYAAQSELPKPQAPRQYLQPDLNTNQSDIDKFVNTYNQYKNLKIDNNNRMALQYGVRSTPTIIRLKQDKVIEKLVLSGEQVLPKSEHIPITENHLSLEDMQSISYNFATPSSKLRLILFADALCPSRHLPKCQEKARTHEQLLLPNHIEKLTVLKPFYVSRHEAKAYQQRFAPHHPVLFDTHNALFRKYDITSLPYWLLLDKNHQVIYKGAIPPSKALLSN
ncbi:hypothetical protein ACSLBF_17430 [Pseudoalteromonas sp. T1lg65]|uniref:hypothetical protein n=1 Tax=Pseudoalteromonas sp. T1lg65 TaxID=2077101 RepID=UPI003F7AD618